LVADSGISGEFDAIPSGYAIKVVGNSLILTFDAICQPVAAAARRAGYGTASAAISASASARL
jgi:hypothetical protein